MSYLVSIKKFIPYNQIIGFGGGFGGGFSVVVGFGFVFVVLVREAHGITKKPHILY